MKRYTTVLKSTNRMDEMPKRTGIYSENLAESSNESSSSQLTTNSDTNSSDTNNETVTLTNSSAMLRFRPNGRRFFGKSKSAAVSRSSSSNRLMTADNIFINSSEEQLSTSESDSELNSEKLVYKNCLENPAKSVHSKKNRPESSMIRKFQFNSIDQNDSNRRFIKNNNRSSLRTCKSMSNCKNSNLFQHNNDDDDDDDDDDDEKKSYFYNKQLDGRMKKGKLSRFKVIKSKSNSTLQNNLNKHPYDHNCEYFSKGNQKDDQITSQQQLNELAERLKFIERKLIENELKTEKKINNITQNITPSSYHNQPTNINQSNQIYSSNQNFKQIDQNNHSHTPFYRPSVNHDDLSLKDGQFHQTRIYPSISFGDCSEINLQNKNPKSKRNFFSSAKSVVKNSKSIPSLFIPHYKDKSEKSSTDKLSNLPGSNIKSTNKIWKPFNILGNLVDDKILGKWHSSSKSVKSSSSSNSIRSNSICSASNLPNAERVQDQQKKIFGPIFHRKENDSKISNNKFTINNLNNRKNSQTNQSNASSIGDLERSSYNTSNNSSRFSSTKHLDIYQPNNLKDEKKTRAFSTPNEEVLINLLSLPFLEEENLKQKQSPESDKFNCKIKQSKSYKEINSKALEEIEEFEKLLSNKFSK